MSRYTFSDMLACAERELRMRRRVYPRWVSEGRMTKAKADLEIGQMAAITDHLRQQAEGERLL